ncbi:MAG: DUF1801 domain-containing protein [Actinobacteria bacterium]|nr:DUF1801 domain-containing protein [Actinomycetota bacterium]
MVSSNAATVTDYLTELPPDRRKAISEVRKMIRANLPRGYRETMNWGMITYEIPLSRYPDTYNKKPLGYLGLASQKNNMTLYLYGAYLDEEQFKKDYRQTGKPLDMSKSCLHFKQVDDLALDFLAKNIASTTPDQLIERYEKSRGNR